MRLLPFGFLFVILPAYAQQLDFLNRNQSLLDAHNCYPYEGKYADRIDRALRTRDTLGKPIGIEQDLAWYVDPATGKGSVVVSHTAKTTGVEPHLRDHFFERMRPFVEKALKENKRSQWPLIVVHFDFKDNQAPLLHAVWDLLGEYQPWITTATKSHSLSKLEPFDARPLLVLTEDSDPQEEVFYKEVPIGAKLRLFGSAHTTLPKAANATERMHLAATVAPAILLAEKPTNYRRWWNNSWYEVEEGGQPRAGDWTPVEDARLKALVDYAHSQGFWIRFYTLDGFAKEDDQGWGNSYNFGSHQAVELRWKAAIDAGVDLIATDQYEDFAAFMKRSATPGKVH